MSDMMQGGQPPDPQAAQAATSGNYPSNNDPAAQLFAKACEIIGQAIQVEPDPQVKAQAAKLLAQCHGLIAGGEKQHDAALGLSPALKFVQRQQAAQQAGGGGGDTGQ